MILGVIIVILWITLQEKFGFRVAEFFRSTFTTIFGTPQMAYEKFLSYYRSFNRKLTEILIGKKRLETRTQTFFKRTLLYTSIVSIWTFLAGIYVGLDPTKFSQSYTNASHGSIILFTAFVLLIAGFVSGIIIFALITRYFDLMNRKKYIASEFIKEPRTDD